MRKKNEETGTRNDKVSLASRGKSEVISMRIDPKAKFGLDLFARMTGQTAAQVAERAIHHFLQTATLKPASVAPEEEPLEKGSYRDVFNTLWSPHCGERFMRMVLEHPKLLTYGEECAWSEMARAGVFNGYFEAPITLRSKLLPGVDLRSLEDRVSNFLAGATDIGQRTS